MAGRPSTKTTATKAVKVEEVVQEVQEAVEEVKVTPKPEKKKYDADDLISVRSGVSGKLVYKSLLNNGYSCEWEKFGDTQQVPFGELRTAAGSQPNFYKKKYWLFDNEEDVVALGVKHFYADMVGIEDVMSVFKMPMADFDAKVKPLNAQLRETIAKEARILYMKGELDSIKRIKALEDATGFSIMEASKAK